MSIHKSSHSGGSIPAVGTQDPLGSLLAQIQWSDIREPYAIGGESSEHRGTTGYQELSSTYYK